MLQDLIFQQTLRQYFPRWMVSIYSWVPNKYPPLVNFWIFFQPPNPYLDPPFYMKWSTGLKWVKQILSLRKKCPYSELFWSAFSPHFPAFGLNAERYRLSLRIQSECGKNADQNNSEYELFLRSVSLQLFKKLSSIILLGWFLNKIPMNWMDWKR